MKRYTTTAKEYHWLQFPVNRPICTPVTTDYHAGFPKHYCI